MLHILHCPLSGPDLIYISLLIIFCIIEYVTNKTLKHETCLRDPVGSKDFQEIGPLHLVHIKEGDEWKTAFNTPLGHFELHFWGLLKTFTVESPGEDQQTEGQLHPSGSWTPSRPCPPSPLLPHATLNSDTTTPPPAPHTPRTPPPPPSPLQTVTRTSHFVQHWNYLYLIQLCL